MAKRLMSDRLRILELATEYPALLHSFFNNLANSPASIAQFLKDHSPLPGHVALPDAPFWSPAQACFLREALAQDNDWAQQADQLNKALR